jgi:hypothetical protein
MHLQQTKLASRLTGGPQYWLQAPTEEVSTYLGKHRAVPVALMTPYGATRSSFIALHRNFKLQNGRVVAANAQHDRIQAAAAGQSIGEAIRGWYSLPGGDFERIDIEIEVRDGSFYTAPLCCFLRGKQRPILIERPLLPLSFTSAFRSRLWCDQLNAVRRRDARAYTWAIMELRRVVAAYQAPVEPNIQEADVLRASGPLNICGVALGPYAGRGYDCCKSSFQFLNYVCYEVPVEVKKRSSGFKYQQQKYGKEELSRAVVLCVHHDLPNFPDRNIDVIELNALAKADVAA